ncbi:MAG: hypothetical protein IJ068_03515 [Bacilli bacterium]|nr:hypothetical protein [Bacilli bacterium]
MNLEISVNEYLLAWYLLYGTSLSKEIDRFRKNLWNKYNMEYNFCYKDKNEIIKYGKDFIPDNDILYNEIFNSELYLSLKKETNRHKMYLSKIFNSDGKKNKKYLKEILKMELTDNYNIYVIHPRMEIIEYYNNHSILWGSDRDKYDALRVLMLTIIKGIIKEDKEHKEIIDSIIELAGINEMGQKLGGVDSYSEGNPSLKVIKRQIYPFWLMYLGYDTKESILDKMILDKIGFDIDNYPIDKNMKKMDLQEFTDFCIKNSKHILKLGNVLKLSKNEDIEVI